jgi:hypothetical protein
VYVKAISIQNRAVSITVANLSTDLATATVTDPGRQRVVFYTAVGDTAGYLKFALGGIVCLLDNPEGVYRFSSTALEFVPSAVVLTEISGLRSIQDVSGTPAQGRIVGGEGIRLQTVGSTIIVDAIGDPYYRRDTCEESETMGKYINPIRRIQWQDLKLSRSGIIRPVSGRVVSRVQTGDAGTRGFASPGENGTLVSMIGA